MSIENKNTGATPIFRLFNSSEFQGVNRIFALSFEDNALRAGQAEYFSQKVKIKEYNVMINGKNNIFDQLVKK